LFQGIQLNVGAATSDSVQGNTIQNIVWTSSSAGTTVGGGPFTGIYVQAGNVNIGTVTANTIGSGTGTGSIAVTSSGSGGTTFGFGSTSGGAVAIANNTIGSITTSGTSTGVSASLVGIQVTAGANTIANNIVGSSTTASSLNASTSATSVALQLTGIRNSSGGSCSFTIDYALINGGSVSAGNSIEYFVVAQDAANNFTSSPIEATASANPPVPNTSARPGAGVNSYSILGTLSGTVTVGPGGSYPTLTGPGGLFAALNSGVLTGNLTVNLTGNTAEDGSTVLNATKQDTFPNTFTVTIRPDSATTRTISGFRSERPDSPERSEPRDH